MIDAVVALPLNVFYGAGVPACLLILNKNRPRDRRDKVLLVYAARHYRELSNKNQLRPQDVMRILVHYHAYGDAKKAEKLVKQHGQRLREVIGREEAEEIARITAEYQDASDKLARLEVENGDAQAALDKLAKKPEREKLQKTIDRIIAAMTKVRKQLDERDAKIAERRRRAEEDRQAVHLVGQELGAMYGDPVELGKHARVVEFAEIQENEFNLYISRYVDTFEPEEPIDVNEALHELDEAEEARHAADRDLRRMLAEVGYAAD